MSEDTGLITWFFEIFYYASESWKYQIMEGEYEIPLLCREWSEESSEVISSFKTPPSLKTSKGAYSIYLHTDQEDSVLGTKPFTSSAYGTPIALEYKQGGEESTVLNIIAEKLPSSFQKDIQGQLVEFLEDFIKESRKIIEKHIPVKSPVEFPGGEDLSVAVAEFSEKLASVLMTA